MQVIQAPLPKAPPDSSVSVHWLAIEGVQLAIPESAPVEGIIIFFKTLVLCKSRNEAKFEYVG